MMRMLNSNRTSFQCQINRKLENLWLSKKHFVHVFFVLTAFQAISIVDVWVCVCVWVAVCHPSMKLCLVIRWLRTSMFCFSFLYVCIYFPMFSVCEQTERRKKNQKRIKTAENNGKVEKNSGSSLVKNTCLNAHIQLK